MIAPTNPKGSGHAGFSASIDHTAARRQLHMSAGVVVVLALAIVASVVALRSDHAVDTDARRAPISVVSAVSSATMTAAQQG